MKIVLITDCNSNFSSIDIHNHKLEGNTHEQNERLINSLRKTGYETIVYYSIHEFEKNISKHCNDIILPLYYGENSPNQKNILPALCELHKLQYIGADSYTHSICNDKYLSKLYATSFNIKSAKSRLIRLKDITTIKNKIKALSLPLVIKPNFGGGSVGISSKNIAQSYKGAEIIIIELLEEFKLPILVEEYIEGFEVELILVGTDKQITFDSEVQLLIGENQYYENEIWGLETKKIDDTSINFKISHYISDIDKKNIIALFQSFSKIEFARIDGRVNRKGEFYLIELSPDSYLGDDCAFYYAFNQNKIEHHQMFKYLIGNHLNSN